MNSVVKESSFFYKYCDPTKIEDSIQKKIILPISLPVNLKEMKITLFKYWCPLEFELFLPICYIKKFIFWKINNKRIVYSFKKSDRANIMYGWFTKRTY